MVQIQGKTVLLRVGGEFELSGFNCSVKGQGTYFEGLISSALITLYIPQMDSGWTLLHSSTFAAANVQGLPSGC